MENWGEVGNRRANGPLDGGKKAPSEGVFPKKLNFAGTCILPPALIYLIFPNFLAHPANNHMTQPMPSRGSHFGKMTICLARGLSRVSKIPIPN